MKSLLVFILLFGSLQAFSKEKDKKIDIEFTLKHRFNQSDATKKIGSIGGKISEKGILTIEDLKLEIPLKDLNTKEFGQCGLLECTKMPAFGFSLTTDQVNKVAQGILNRNNGNKISRLDAASILKACSNILNYSSPYCSYSSYVDQTHTVGINPVRLGLHFYEGWNGEMDKSDKLFISTVMDETNSDLLLEVEVSDVNF